MCAGPFRIIQRTMGGWNLHTLDRVIVEYIGCTYLHHLSIFSYSISHFNKPFMHRHIRTIYVQSGGDFHPDFPISALMTMTTKIFLRPPQNVPHIVGGIFGTEASFCVPKIEGE
jgi:hypothetical protein